MILLDFINNFVLLDDILSVLVWIVAIPSIALGSVAHNHFCNLLIFPEVFARPLRTNFARSLNTSLRCVSGSTAVSAGTFAILGHLGGGNATLCRLVDTCEAGGGATLVLESFVWLLLRVAHVPGCLLDVLGHVGQVLNLV